MSCAIFTVIYPGVMKYIPELVSSLSKQTDKDFTLFVINDGISNSEDLFKDVDFDVKITSRKGTPAELRKAGINWVLSEGSEKIIFVDADDYVKANRVAVSKTKLKESDIVCNELMLVGEEFDQPTPMLGGRLEEGQEVKASDIINKNCFGLTNTAIRSEIISKEVDMIPDDIIAFDWVFFTLCLRSGAKSILTKETETYYRQHGGNIAPVLFSSETQVMRGVNVKRGHYQFLLRQYEEYVSLADTFSNLLFQLQDNETFKQKYVDAVKKNGLNATMWWEAIKPPEELGICF